MTPRADYYFSLTTSLPAPLIYLFYNYILAHLHDVNWGISMMVMRLDILRNLYMSDYINIVYSQSVRKFLKSVINAIAPRVQCRNK